VEKSLIGLFRLGLGVVFCCSLALTLAFRLAIMYSGMTNIVSNNITQHYAPISSYLLPCMFFFP
jgi:hypothetical protein